MNVALSVEKPEPFLSKRRLTWAGLAAIGGCAAVCSLPLLLVAAGGSAAATTIAGFLGAGSELVVGGLAFAGALGVMALRARATRTAACSTSCAIDKASSGTSKLAERTKLESEVHAEGIPVVCDPGVFSKDERVAHADRAKELLGRRPVRREVLDDGFAFHYDGREDLFAALAQWASSEHRCCPWARFSVEMEPFPPGSSGAIRLRMTGGPEAKALLLEAIEQLDTDGPVVRDFLQGDRKLTAAGLAGRARSCGC